LKEPEAQNLSCAHQPWFKPISLVDVLAYQREITLLFSSVRLVGAIAAAQPPGAVSQWSPREAAPKELPSTGLGSNGWAIGAERSTGGHGMLVANPHLPWDGELRWWENQLTVPGQLNVYGATLIGAPGILIGFNDNVAWTHTVSGVGARFTAYTLQLVPGKPTHYLYDGQEREMSSQVITVPVLQPDGSLQNVSRTYYSSHYGPMISLPGAGWTTTQAFTYRDTNIDNDRFTTQYLGMDRVRDMKEFQGLYDTVQGAPWVHTMAADREGGVWYSDVSSTPNARASTIQVWQQGVATPGSLQAQMMSAGIILFDGSTSRDEWVDVPGARAPGLISPPMVPRLARRDVVFNSNDSYWLIHPTITLDGFSPMEGPERTARTVRTRMNGKMLSEVREGGASGADGLFTLEELQTAILSDRSYSAELLREAVVQRCQAHPQGTASGKTVDLTRACAVLAAWDGRFEASRAGPALWRELIATYSVASLTSAGDLFATPFSPSSPLTTPTTLVPAPATGADPLLNQLAAAVLQLQQAGISVDKPLGEVQFAPRWQQHVPLHGGQDMDGVANVVTYNSLLVSTIQPPTPRGPVLNNRTNLTTGGYVVNLGTSFLMALEFVPDGVKARALLTYGQTGNEALPSFRDQLPLYSNKQWRDVVFSESDIARDHGYQRLHLTQD
ncbi:MAG: penicillin acylase family protein, partial [Archangium sp.]